MIKKSDFLDEYVEIIFQKCSTALEYHHIEPLFVYNILFKIFSIDISPPLNTKMLYLFIILLVSIYISEAS